MDPKIELALEGLMLQCETMAAGMLVQQATLQHIANESGIVIDDVKLNPDDKAKHMELLRSIARRIMRLAILSAQSEGVEVDEDTIKKNTISMLQDAIKTKGESLKDPNALGDAVFDGTSVGDAVMAERAEEIERKLKQKKLDDLNAAHDEMVAEANKDYAIDDEPKSVVNPFEVTDEGVEEIEEGGWEEEPENMEPATDEDLLAVFRSTRKKRVEDPYVEFENGVIRANFFNPETLPEDPEEFMDYERQAIEYFKSITEKARKSKLLDKRTANQVVVVLHGGVNFQEDQVMTADRKLMQLITEQGHDQPYFEAKVENSIEAAEALITAYSVSIARLRGAYMQAKLQELQEYVEQHG